MLSANNLVLLQGINQVPLINLDANELEFHRAAQMEFNHGSMTVNKKDGKVNMVDKINGPMTLTTNFGAWVDELQNLDGNGFTMHNCVRMEYHEGHTWCVKRDGKKTEVGAINGPMMLDYSFGNGFDDEMRLLQNLDGNGVELHNCVHFEYHSGHTWCVKRDGKKTDISAINGPLSIIGSFGTGFGDEKPKKMLLNLDENQIELHNGKKWDYHDGRNDMLKKDGKHTKIDKTNGPMETIGNFGKGDFKLMLI